MNPLGASLTILFALGVLVLGRRGAAFAVMAATCYLTQGQMIIVGGFHFTSIRIVLLAGFIRIFVRGDIRLFTWNVIDKVFFSFMAVQTIIHMVGRGTSDAFVYQVGCTYNMLLPYLVFRCLINGPEETEQFMYGMAIFIIPFAVAMIMEAFTNQNIFSTFGGVSLMSSLREGHVRCMGTFRTAISAGIFGATLAPIFVCLIMIGRRRLTAVAGLAAATAIVITSRSSGPLMSFVGGFIALSFWRWRDRMKKLRWTILIVLVFLHLIMKAPVWYLMARVGDLLGGSGWHRAYLIDQFINHFSIWWWQGTDDTGTWMPTALSIDGTADVTNEYIANGLRAGLLCLILFVAVIVKGFSQLGLAARQLRGISSKEEWLFWGLGAALFATVTSFFSLSYFDQIQEVWYLLLAVISGASAAVLAEEPVTVGPDAFEEEMSADQARARMKFTICSAVNDEEVLRSCLLSSPDLSSAGEVILQRGCISAAQAYNRSISAAKNEVVILLHQDIYLPRGWFQRLESSLERLAATDPAWGVVGAYGITPTGVYHGHIYCNAGQTVLGRPFQEATEVGSLDEVVLILRKSSGLRFDPAMKGFHFYAADICLSARQRGMKNYVVPAFCFHNANSYGMFPRSFWEGYFYIRRKWRAALPVRTPCVEISRSLRPFLRDTVWRFCWLQKSRRPLARRVPNPGALCEEYILKQAEKPSDNPFEQQNGGILHAAQSQK